MRQWGPLGEVLARDPADDQLRTHVRELTDRAAGLLTRVPETFRAYTLHDARHAENVIALMGRLAAPGLERMTPLEAALLILAAYYHDIGMVYTEPELAAIPADPAFHAFLADRAEEYLACADSPDDPPRWVIVRYCRHRHADRVADHLRRVDPDLLTWRAFPFRDELELICRSHNRPAADLHLPEFLTDFVDEADLRMCAVLLRLADILDLDRSRTPPAVYEHLGLAARATVDEAISDDEWRKHLRSSGFVIPRAQVPNYGLQFVATPDNPGVEHGLRTFLTVVDDELQQCRAVRDVCGDRWRSLPLPGRVDTAQIKSIGYKYGEFRFELDRSAVLDLFGGEQLYGSPVTFVRELLQNALDAARLRRHLHGDGADPAGVDVRCWADPGGHLWFRVDDNGIGMDETAIRNYFLRVGRSYYRSPEFRASLLRSGGSAESFGAISRFGIGVLSCFMAGDLVEMSTKHVRADGTPAPALRLSLTRDQDYFVLQEEGPDGAPMPSPAGGEAPFRTRPGTSIAVRIDPHRTGVTPDDLRRGVGEYVLRPPVPVRLDGEPMPEPVDVAELMDARPQLHRVPVESRTCDSGSLPYLGPLGLCAVPLRLRSPDGPIRVDGLLVAVVAVWPPDAPPSGDLFEGWPPGSDAFELLRREFRNAVVRRTFSVEAWHTSDAFALSVEHGMSDEDVARVRSATGTRAGSERVYPAQRHQPAVEYARAIAMSPETLGDILDDEYGHPSECLAFRTDTTLEPVLSTAHLPGLAEPDDLDLDAGVEWSYNGIRLPNEPVPDLPGTLFWGAAADPHIFGSIHLAGGGGPDLTVARDRLRGVPFPLHSAVQLAVHRAIDDLPAAVPPVVRDQLRRVALIDQAPVGAVTFGAAAADPLIDGGWWASARIIGVDGEYRDVHTVAELAAGTPGGVVIEIPSHRHTYDCYADLIRTLIQREFEARWEPDPGHGSRGSLRVLGRRATPHPPGAGALPPLFAVPYDTSPEVAVSANPRPSYLGRAFAPFLNADHALVRWLVAHAATLATDFAAPFQRLFFSAPASLDDPDSVNEALDQIARARPSIAPPPAAYLRRRKDGWLVSR